MGKQKELSNTYVCSNGHENFTSEIHETVSCYLCMKPAYLSPAPAVMHEQADELASIQSYTYGLQEQIKELTCQISVKEAFIASVRELVTYQRLHCSDQVSSASRLVELQDKVGSSKTGNTLLQVLDRARKLLASAKSTPEVADGLVVPASEGYELQIAVAYFEEDVLGKDIGRSS